MRRWAKLHGAHSLSPASIASTKVSLARSRSLLALTIPSSLTTSLSYFTASDLSNSSIAIAGFSSSISRARAQVAYCSLPAAIAILNASLAFPGLSFCIKMP